MRFQFGSEAAAAVTALAFSLAGFATLAETVDPLARVAMSLARGEKAVVVPKGTYRLQPKGSSYLTLDGLSDVTLDFSGSDLIGLVRTRMMTIRNCTNVTIRNVSVDYDELPFTQGRITAVGPRGEWSVRIFDGYPRPEGAQLGDKAWPMQAYDGKTLLLKNAMRRDNGFRIERTGEDTYLVTGGRNLAGAVGDVAVWSVKDFSRPVEMIAFYAERSKGVVFEDVSVWSTPHGCAFAESLCDGDAYRRCVMDRRPPEQDIVKRGFPRLRSGNHDGLDSRGCTRGPTIDGCRFRYGSDDCVNISGMYSFVTEQRGRELRILVNWLGLSIDPGDLCRLLTFEGHVLPAVRVLSVRPDGKATDAEGKFFESLGLWPGLARTCSRAYRLTVDREDALPKGTLIISTRHEGSGFVVRNSSFGQTRANGLLLAASDGIVENNAFEGCFGSGIRLWLSHEWLEGGGSSNVKIIGNRLDFNGRHGKVFGIYVGGEPGNKKDLPVDAHRNIEISGNSITKTWGGVNVIGCTGLRIGDNRIDVTGPKEEFRSVVGIDRGDMVGRGR